MLQPEEDASLAEAESAASFVRSMAVFFATTLLSLEIVMTLADATADAPPSVQRTLGLVYRNGGETLWATSSVMPVVGFYLDASQKLRLDG